MGPQLLDLAKLSLEVLRQLQTLASLADNKCVRDPLDDALMRFQVWTQSTHASHHGRASLDHRLRDASKLRESLEAELGNLQEDIADCKFFVVSSDTNIELFPVINTLSTMSKVEIAVFGPSMDNRIADWAPSVLASMGSPSPTPLEEQSNLGDLFGLIKAVHEDISSLFELSALTKQTTQRDHHVTVLADTGGAELDMEIDMALMRIHFPELNRRTSRWLLRQLAQASHVRRRYSKFREDSQAQMTASFPPSSPQDEVDVVNDQVRADPTAVVRPFSFHVCHIRMTLPRGLLRLKTTVEPKTMNRCVRSPRTLRLRSRPTLPDTRRL